MFIDPAESDGSTKWTTSHIPDRSQLAGPIPHPSFHDSEALSVYDIPSAKRRDSVAVNSTADISVPHADRDRQLTRNEGSPGAQEHNRFVTIATWANHRTLWPVGPAANMPLVWVDDQGDTVEVQLESYGQSSSPFAFQTQHVHTRLPDMLPNVDQSNSLFDPSPLSHHHHQYTAIRRGSHGVDDDDSSDSSFGSPPDIISPSQAQYSSYFATGPCLTPAQDYWFYAATAETKRYVYGRALSTVVEECEDDDSYDMHDSGIEYSDKASPEIMDVDSPTEVGWAMADIARPASGVEIETRSSLFAMGLPSRSSAPPVLSRSLPGDSMWPEDARSYGSNKESEVRQEKPELTVDDFAELADLWDASFEHVIGTAKLAPATQVCLEMMCASSEAARKYRQDRLWSHRITTHHFAGSTEYMTHPSTPTPAAY